MKKAYLNSEKNMISLLKPTRAMQLFLMVFTFKNSRKLKLFFTFLLFALLQTSGFGATKTWDGGGDGVNWSSANNWNNNGVPANGDDVVIPNGFTVTVNGNYTCASVTFTGASATLTVNTGNTLTVTGAITLQSTNGASRNAVITGAGSISAATVNVGSNVSPSSDRTTIMTSTIANFNLTGNLNIYSNRNGGDTNDATFNLQSGVLNVDGQISTTNEHSSNTSTFTMATGAQSGTLLLGNANPFNLSGTGSSTITLNGSGATVNYDGAGSQTVRATTYNNFTLSGSGTKTFAGTTTITNNLSIASGVDANLGAFTHTANSLTLGGTGTTLGSWGSTTSAATNTNNTFFSAVTGIVNIAAAGGCNTPVTVIPNKVDKCSTSNNGSITPTFTGGLANVRYIKLSQKYADNLHLAEIQAFEVFTGINVALSTNGAMASASSVYSSDYPVSEINDGILTDNTNMWHGANGVNDWVQIDLQSAKNLDYLRIHNRTASNWNRAQNILLELFDGSNNLIYCKTINVWENVNASHYIDVNVLNLSWSDGATTLNRTGLAAGTYTLNYADGAGYTVNTPITIVAADPTITTAATPAVVTAVCQSASAQTTTMAYIATANNPTSYSIVWTGLANQASTPFAFTAAAGSVTGITVPAGTAAGTYSGTMTIANANGCTVTKTVTLTVIPASVGGSVTGGTAICSGSNSGTLTLSGNTGSIVKWQSSVSPFSVWTDIANTDATYTSGVLTQTTQFRAVVQSSSCSSANSAATTVYVNVLPVITPNKIDETCPTSNDGSISPLISGGLTNIQYIKLTQKYVDPDAWQQVQEIQAFEIFTGTNVALQSNGATATASSTYSNTATFGPQRAIDGDYTGYSFWHSNSVNTDEYIKIDLPAAKNIDYLRIHNRVDCCWSRGQNMLLELYDSSNTLVYSKTVDLWGGVNGAHYIDVNVLDISWSDGAAVLNRTGLDSGTYTLNYADAAGCSASLPITVGAINPLPTSPTVVSTTQPTCVVSTGSVVLSGLPAGSWTINPGGITGSTSSATISGLIPGTYNFTVSNGTCSSVPTGNVVINPVITTTWNGTVWAPSTPTSSDAAIINGNYSVSSNGNLDVCSLTINAGYRLSIESDQFVVIQNHLTIGNGAILDVLDKGSLVMVNDLGVVTNTGTGTAIVRRRTTPFKKSDYIYWSTPVSTTAISSASTGAFPGWKTGSAYQYNDAWVAAFTMTPGKGYIVMVPDPTALPGGNESGAIFKGRVNNGVYNVNVVANKSYLIGNPYPSAIDADQFILQNSGVIGGALYFWTHATAIQLASNIPGTAGSGAYAYTSDDYATYNIVGGVGAVTAGNTNTDLSKVIVPNGKIASGQGFFTTTKTSSLAGTSFVFNNSMRISSGAGSNFQFFKTKNSKNNKLNASAIEKHRIWLNLSNTQGAFKQTLLGYVSGATNGDDVLFDGKTLDGNKYVDFYSVNQSKNLVIQGRALPFDDKDEVPLGYKTAIDGTFAINIDKIDGLLVNQAIFLQDKLTNTEFDLKSGSYTFTTAKGTFNNRFVLKYKSAKTLDTETFDAQAEQVVVTAKNKQIKINSSAEKIKKVLIYDVSGKQIYKNETVDSDEIIITGFTTADQVLILKTTLQNGAVTTDKIVF